MQKPLPSFEHMLDMAQNNPDALEQLRAQMVREAINEAPEHSRQRLRGLQFQIDGQRLVSHNPMQACLEISRMMHESLNELKGYIDERTGDKAMPSVAIEPAKILSFPSEAL